MPITVYTPRPKTLLNNIYEAINDASVRSWSYNENGDFIHDSVQWGGKARLKASIGEGFLSLKVLKNKSVDLSRDDIAFHKATFAQMLLVHFEGEFESIELK